MDKEIITVILAIWGALLSSIAIGWNIFRDLVGRGRLRVSCYIGNIVGGPEGIDPNNYLVWSITNIGKEPVVLTHIGGGFKDKEFMLTPHAQLPRMMQPGEYILEYTNSLNLLEDDLKFLAAIDSLGKKYKAPRKQVRRLKKEYARGEYSEAANGG
jgi:hypothetical protein